MHIRRAVPRDAEAIARLAAQAAAEEGAHSVLEADRVRAHAFGANALFETWVAQDNANSPLIAHAIFTKGYDVRRACANVEVCDLFIAPSHRRGGLARKLMSAVARRARELGARDLIITTGVENAVAQRFFAAIGAQPQQAAVFKLSADGIEWLSEEGR